MGIWLALASKSCPSRDIDECCIAEITLQNRERT